MNAAKLNSLTDYNIKKTRCYLPCLFLSDKEYCFPAYSFYKGQLDTILYQTELSGTEIALYIGMYKNNPIISHNFCTGKKYGGGTYAHRRIFHEGGRKIEKENACIAYI